MKRQYFLTHPDFCGKIEPLDIPQPIVHTNRIITCDHCPERINCSLGNHTDTMHCVEYMELHEVDESTVFTLNDITFHDSPESLLRSKSLATYVFKKTLV